MQVIFVAVYFGERFGVLSFHRLEEERDEAVRPRGAMRFRPIPGVLLVTAAEATLEIQLDFMWRRYMQPVVRRRNADATR